MSIERENAQFSWWKIVLPQRIRNECIYKRNKNSIILDQFKNQANPDILNYRGAILKGKLIILFLVLVRRNYMAGKHLKEKNKI